MNTTIHKAFTLMEMLIVIVIIAILALISLRLNWSQIWEMEAMNEREQRLSRHRKQNNLITNTNYLNNNKINEVTFQYTSTGITMTYSGWQSDFMRNKQTLSGNTILTKKTLSLGCQATNTTIELNSKTKTSCFTLNTSLCARTPCSTSQ